MAYKIWKDGEYMYCNVKYSKLNISDEGGEGEGLTSSSINKKCHLNVSAGVYLCM